MAQTGNRKYADASGPLGRACPTCAAPIGHTCMQWAVDPDGTRYVRRRLLSVHRERRSSRKN